MTTKRVTKTIAGVEVRLPALLKTTKTLANVEVTLSPFRKVTKIIACVEVYIPYGGTPTGQNEALVVQVI